MRSVVHIRQIHLLALAMTVLFGGTLAAQEPGWHKFGEGRTQKAPPPIAANLVLGAGTWITIRVDERLSSDRNQTEDFFTATLVQPLVANGFVVARRGQIVGCRVTEAVKGGRGKGTSRLGLEITEISLVDGQQLPVKTQPISRNAKVVSPEMVLTFRLEAPLNISTERSAGAFQPVTREDYEQPTLNRRGPPAPPPPTW